MVYYCSLFFILMMVLFSNIYNERNLFYFYIFVVLWLIASLRLNVGADYESYLWHIELIKSQTLSESYFEPLFYYMVQLIDLLKWPDNVFFSISSLITLFFIWLSSNDENKFKVIIIYFLICYLYSLVGIRQALACAIVLYAHVLFFNKKYKSTILILLLAFISHYSAMFAIVCMSLYFIKVNKILSLIIVLSFCIFVKTYSIQVFIQNLPFAENLPYYSYIVSDLFQKPDVGSGLGVLIKLSLPLISIIFILSMRKENTAEILNYLFKINLLLFLFTILGTEINIINRVTLLFYYVVILSYIIIGSHLISSKKRLFNFSFISICLVFFTMTVISGSGSYKISPYSTLIFKS